MVWDPSKSTYIYRTYAALVEAPGQGLNKLCLDHKENDHKKVARDAPKHCELNCSLKDFQSYPSAPLKSC